MKHITSLLAFALVLSFAINSCDDTGNEPVTTDKGHLYIVSVPTGAQIWLNGVNTNKVTPDSIKNLSAIDQTITLKLSGYRDTTFTVRILANQTVMRTIVLNSDEEQVSFGPVRIWETIGTTSAQPSGLDLSTGNAYGISSTDKDKVDIYYSSDGFLVQSAHLSTQMTRKTWFEVGAGTDLNDGVDSPVQTTNWKYNVGDRETKYFFLYDADGHYSKAKIVAYGGGTPGNPAWVEITWWYNKKVNDVRFP
ncbi:MAG: PEGA domain-containing protein [Bacteroidota bacterium]|nr:PEGA domain-containing protein [Bacteroidota bacterium]